MAKVVSIKTITLLTSIFMLVGCGQPVAPAKHVHTFSPDWTFNNTYHWHEATCEHTDQKSGYAPHTWGKWIIDEEATPEEQGRRHHVCQICDCSVSDTYEYVDSIPATRLYMSTDPTTSNIHVGSTRTLKPIIYPSDATKNIKYISENENIISIDENGVLKGESAGTALLTAYNDNNNDGVMDDDEPRQYACYTIVTPDDSYGITLNKTEITLKVGEETTISPSAKGFRPSFYSNYVSDSTIATAYQNKIKGLKPGVTNLNVYASVSNGQPAYEANCTITVIDNTDSTGLRADGIEFNEEVENITIGESFSPSYEITPTGTVDTVSKIESNNENVSITNGVVTGVKAGTSILKVTTTNGKFDRMQVVVSDGTTQYDNNYNNYYGELTWENSEDLKTKLHNIISENKKSLKYNGSPTNWDSNKDADSCIGDDTKVNAIYTNTPIDKNSTNSGWQREHCLAASLMTGITTGDAVKTLGRATDFHNLYAASASGNTSRGNKNFGYADVDSYRYGSKEGTNTCYDDKNFEPADIDKGKVARAIFYMGVMYDSEEEFSTDGIKYNAKPIEIIEDYVDYTAVTLTKFTNTDKAQNVRFADNFREIVRALNPEVTDEDEITKLAYQYYKNSNNPSSIGNLSTLLMWNAYAVTGQEMQHNNSVQTYNSSAGGGIQGNRNPFVDYPELVEYVYGSLKDQPGTLRNLRPSILDVDMTKPDHESSGGEGGEGGDPTSNVKFEDCKYQFETSSKPQDLVSNGVATFGSLTWDFETANEVTLGSSNGLKIGTASSGAGTVTLTTQTLLTDVDAVVLRLYCPKNLDYTYDIYVGDDKVANDVSLKQEASAITDYPFSLETAKSGKVKIILKNLTSYISLKGIAINCK